MKPYTLRYMSGTGVYFIGRSNEEFLFMEPRRTLWRAVWVSKSYRLTRIALWYFNTFKGGK